MTSETIQSLEARKVELDRMMENLRKSICSENHSLAVLRQKKHVLIDKIYALKSELKKQPKQ